MITSVPLTHPFASVKQRSEPSAKSHYLEVHAIQSHLLPHLFNLNSNEYLFFQKEDTTVTFCSVQFSPSNAYS